MIDLSLTMERLRSIVSPTVNPVEGVEVMDAVVDGMTTTELVRRYNLKSRSTLTNRMNALGIAASRGMDNRTYYVSMESVEALDSLHKLLERNGAKLDECASMVMHGRIPDTSVSSAIAPTTTIQLLTPVEELASLKQQQECYRILQEVADNEWIIPTSMVLKLIGLKSLPKTKHGMFERRGFVFVAAENQGREREWRVGKY